MFKLDQEETRTILWGEVEYDLCHPTRGLGPGHAGQCFGRAGASSFGFRAIAINLFDPRDQPSTLLSPQPETPLTPCQIACAGCWVHHQVLLRHR
jgi:hypothetical protein